MAISLERRLFTVDEYEQMIDAGILREDDRVELIQGRIVNMAAIKLPHMACVSRLDLLFHERLGRAAHVWVQNAIRISDRSRPEPDIVLLKWRDDLYEGKFPTGEDVLLLIEVAQSSIRYDRTVKAPLYAEAGISHYWVVNLSEQVIEVFSDPGNGGYKSVTQAGRGETLDLPAPLSGTIRAEEVLG